MTTFYPSVSVGTMDMGNPLDLVLDNSGPNNQALYEGTAYPATAVTSGTALWKIRKFFFDSNNLVMGWRWADGSTEFNKDWSLRTTYTYEALT